MKKREDKLPTFEEAETKLLLERLDHFKWDKKKTAESLGCSFKTIYNKLHKIFGHIPE